MEISGLHMNICAVTINYNKPDTTVKCIESLRYQGLSSLVIVENSDNQQAIGVLETMLSSLDRIGLPEDIVVLRTGTNLGYARGMNCAISWSAANRDHRFFLLLNNDTLFPAGGLELLVETCRNNYFKCIVAPAFLDAECPSHFWYQRLFGIMTRRRIPGSFRYLSGCCLLIPKYVIEEKLFDEAFFMYGEDVLLSWRLSQRGIGLLTAGFGISHEGGASSSGNSRFYEYHVLRGHFLLAEKLSSSPFMKVALLIGRIAFFSIRACYRSLRSRSKEPIGVFLQCVRELHKGHAPYDLKRSM